MWFILFVHKQYQEKTINYEKSYWFKNIYYSFPVLDVIEISLVISYVLDRRIEIPYFLIFLWFSPLSVSLVIHLLCLAFGFQVHSFHHLRTAVTRRSLLQILSYFASELNSTHTYECIQADLFICANIILNKKRYLQYQGSININISCNFLLYCVQFLLF